MIEMNIPGRGIIRLEYLVSDVNGTLAVDGRLLDGLIGKLVPLRDRLDIHLLTADTHGMQDSIDHQLNLHSVRIKKGGEAEQKAEYVRQLGADRVIAIGQGSNDAGMLKAAKIGIGIISAEGIAVETMLTADIIVPDIFSALELLEKPIRLVASLRN